MDASAWVSPAATTSAQCVSPRHSRRQLTACHPDRTGSAGRGIRRWAPKNTRPTDGERVHHGPEVAARSRPGCRAGRGRGSASPSRTASSRAAHIRANPSASSRSNTAAMPRGLMRAEGGGHRGRDRPAPGAPPGRRCSRAGRRDPPAGRAPRSGRRHPGPRRSSRRWSAPIGRCAWRRRSSRSWHQCARRPARPAHRHASCRHPSSGSVRVAEPDTWSPRSVAARKPTSTTPTPVGRPTGR